MKRMLACAALLALAGIHPAVAERLIRQAIEFNRTIGNPTARI